MRETTCNDTISGNLTHVTTAQFPYLGCHRVLLDQWFPGKVKLEGIIGTECDKESSLEVLGEGIPVISQEECIVG